MRALTTVITLSAVMFAAAAGTFPPNGDFESEMNMSFWSEFEAYKPALEVQCEVKYEIVDNGYEGSCLHLWHTDTKIVEVGLTCQLPIPNIAGKTVQVEGMAKTRGAIGIVFWIPEYKGVSGKPHWNQIGGWNGADWHPANRGTYDVAPDVKKVTLFIGWTYKFEENTREAWLDNLVVKADGEPIQTGGVSVVARGARQAEPMKLTVLPAQAPAGYTITGRKLPIAGMSSLLPRSSEKGLVILRTGR